MAIALIELGIAAAEWAAASMAEELVTEVAGEAVGEGLLAVGGKVQNLHESYKIARRIAELPPLRDIPTLYDVKPVLKKAARGSAKWGIMRAVNAGFIKTCPTHSRLVLGAKCC